MCAAFDPDLESKIKMPKELFILGNHVIILLQSNCYGVSVPVRETPPSQPATTLLFLTKRANISNMHTLRVCQKYINISCSFFSNL